MYLATDSYNKHPIFIKIVIHREGVNMFSNIRNSSISILFIIVTVTLSISCDDNGSSDQVPPIILATNPMHNETGVAANTVINITVSEAIEEDTLTASFSITGGAVGVLSLNTSNEIITFTPSSILSYDTLYTVTVQSSLKDESGNGLISDYVWSFTTGDAPDTASPYVIETFPDASDTNAPLHYTIKAQFNEVMNASTIDETSFIVTGTTGTVTYDEENKTAVFTPSSSLQASQSYTATLTTAIQDMSTNALSTEFSWGFATTNPVTSINYLTNCTGQYVNLNTDEANCGACGDTCASGELCNSGSCLLSCQSALTDCIGTCTDIYNDETNCGGCGNACAGGQYCVSGSCM